MVACQSPCSRKVALKRGPWTPEEDMRLTSYVKAHGEGRWRSLPKKAGLLRSGKSCRLRWMNYLRPDIKRGHILPDEEDLILRLHRLLGNRWSLIAGRIPGRTDNDIKNYWNCHLSKKLISQGIDPRTHTPLSESEDIWWLRQDCNMDQPILQYTTTHESVDLEKYEKDLNVKIADNKEEQISSSAAQAGISHPQSEPTILAFASQEDFCTKLIESDCSETLKQATPMATTYGNTCSYVNPLDLELFINEEFELREGANAGFNSVSQLSCPNQCELPSPSYHFWSTLHSPTTHYHPSC